ncbi:MAG: hypothetical protein LBH35_10775 [Treponema sp.]|jgi:hypothetical protein|nr:hypothetical protein [Treponema sp.]
MTQIRKKAIELISGMNDEELITVIAFVENLQNEGQEQEWPSNGIEKKRAAFNRLIGLTAENPVSLAEARRERLSKQ